MYKEKLQNFLASCVIEYMQETEACVLMNLVSFVSVAHMQGHVHYVTVLEVCSHTLT